MKEYIKILPEYGCSPIWEIGENKVENIKIEDLNLSSELKKIIIDWQTEFDGILNMNDPIASGFKSEEAEINFGKTGVEIWKMMLKEMGDAMPIMYYNILDDRLYEPTEVNLL